MFAAFGLQYLVSFCSDFETDGTFALVDHLQFERGWPFFGVVKEDDIQDGRGSG